MFDSLTLKALMRAARFTFSKTQFLTVTPSTISSASSLPKEPMLMP